MRFEVAHPRSKSDRNLGRAVHTDSQKNDLAGPPGCRDIRVFRRWGRFLAAHLLKDRYGPRGL